MKSITRHVVALLACVATGTVIPAQAQEQPVNLTIASFQQGSSWYVYAVNLAELLQAELPKGSTVDTPPIAGGTGNPSLVSTGRADAAFGMAVVGSWALQGKHAFKEPLANLRALVGGWDQYFLIPMARGTGFDSDLSNFFKSVRPKANVTLLQRGSVGSFGGEQMLDVAGAGEEALAAQGGSYEFGTFDMVKTRFSSGTGDVFIQVGTVGHPGITEISQQTASTFMQPSAEVLSDMTSRFGWETATLPSGTFPGQDKAVDLPGTTTTLFASAEMSDDVAYKIVSAICNNAPKLQAAHKALADFSCEKGVWREEVNGLPLHPGAERFYREKGWLK